MKRSILQVAFVVALVFAFAPVAFGQGEISLYPTVKAPVGASQAYLMTFSASASAAGMEESESGMLTDMTEFQGESSEYSAWVRYTVLGSGADGAVRLRVEAIGLDGPTTLRPLALPRWEGVLVLAPSEVRWEDEEPTWASELGFQLDWLREFFLAPEKAPEAVRVGDTWEEAVPVGEGPFEELDFAEGTMTVRGEYVEYTRPAPNAPFAAKIVETFGGHIDTGFEPAKVPDWCYEEPSEDAGFDEYLRWLEECFGPLMSDVFPSAVDMDGETTILLVANDFPWSGEFRLRMQMFYGGLGPAEVRLELASNVVRFEGEVAQGEIEELAAGALHRDALHDGSWAATSFGAPTGAPANVYSFTGNAGDGALVEMFSDAFTPYLVLMDEEWEVIAESWGAWGEQAQVFANLPYTGTYYVQATTQNGWVLGDYTIQLQVGPDVVGPEDEWWSWDDFDAGTTSIGKVSIGMPGATIGVTSGAANRPRTG